MNIAIIACIAENGALNGFQPSSLDRAFFKAMTVTPDPDALWATFLQFRTEHTPIEQWHLWFAKIAQYDMEHTSRYNTVLFGRKTFEDTGVWGLATIHLYKRRVMVLTKAPMTPCHESTLDEAIDYAESLASPNFWIAGGAQVYTLALAHPLVKTAYITEVDALAIEEGDNPQFPWPPQGWKLHEETPWLVDRDGQRLRFTQWKRNG